MTRPALGYAGLVNSVTRCALVAPWPLSWLARRVLRAMALWIGLRLALHNSLGLPLPRRVRQLASEPQNRHTGLWGAGGGNPQSEPSDRRHSPPTSRGDVGR